MDTKLATRLQVLADNTLATVFERNRLKQLKLNYDKYETTIQKNLTQLRDGLKTLDDQLKEEEESGVADTKTHEDTLIQLQVKVDKLEALLGNSDDQSARDILLGNRRGKTVRFTSATEDQVSPSDLENGQILQLQQRIIEDQDGNLDQLSDAIRRQRELGIQIGDELDSHVQLIDETETMVERTDAKLKRARKKLDYVGRKMKENRSICIVIVLIFIFFILLALFR